jgi:large subunit ribosomal protein L3
MIGLIGKKVGMTQVFDAKGIMLPVTVIKIEKNTVLQVKNIEKHGYEALLLGACDAKKNKLKKPIAGQYAGDTVPKRYRVEFRNFEKEASINDTFGVELFDGIRHVTVSGISKGKGFQGVMKRHGFHGGNKTHGSKFHRAGGSTGQAASPSRVLPGTKMPGRMGGEKVTTRNLLVVKVDVQNEYLLVKGAVPGRREGVVIVSAAIG